VARVVLDASIVIAVATPADSKHRSAYAALDTRRADELILPASAYTETLVWPMSLGNDAVQQLETFIEEMGIVVAPITREIARRAAELRSQWRSLRLGDAIVLAAGDVLAADEVLTSDRRWAKASERVVLV